MSPSNMETNVDNIIKWLTEQVESKQPISPDTWLEVAQKLNVLIQGEQEKLFEMEQVVARLRNDLLDANESVAHAKSRIEATDEYKEVRKQKAKIDRVNEMIRLSKLQSRMASEIFRGQMPI